MAKGKRAKATELHWTEELAQLDGVHVHDNHRLHQHTPLRVGGPVEAWVRCNFSQRIMVCYAYCTKTVLEAPLKLFEDWLVKDGGLNGVVLRLEGN